jgi:ArsR family transcriptional regulator
VLIPEVLIEAAARRFALLGDPTRLRLLSVLHRAGELPVGELAEQAAVGRENTSQHLARLAAAGLVARRRQGTTVFYRIGDETLDQVCALVCEGVRSTAEALAGG